jgi:hypothetical protein
MAAASAVQEFQDHYKPISDAQRVYEARAEGLLSQLKQNPGAKLEVDTLGNAPWERIRKLPRLGTLLDTPVSRLEPSESPRTEYDTKFLDPLDEASRLLRARLAATLGAPRSARSNC